MMIVTQPITVRENLAHALTEITEGHWGNLAREALHAGDEQAMRRALWAIADAESGSAGPLARSALDRHERLTDTRSDIRRYADQGCWDE
jgi:hypothetical protein